MTRETDNDTAKEQFIKRMNHSDMYFIEEEIPKNESDENAHVLCGDVEGAKKYCPTRWRALQNWFDEAQMVSKENQIITLDYLVIALQQQQQQLYLLLDLQFYVYHTHTKKR